MVIVVPKRYISFYILSKNSHLLYNASYIKGDKKTPEEHMTSHQEFQFK